MKAAGILLTTLIAGVSIGCALQAQPGTYPGGNYPQGGYNSQGGYDLSRAPAPTVEVGFFYNELSPYGEWIYTGEYGWSWFPSRVHASWRPYQDGRWVMTEYGWTWVSNEPFGWATYHYGRWAFQNRIGWIWIPGTDWGPAWVSWQSGGGYVGWAPLPPSIGFEVGVGIRLGGLDLNLILRPDYYSFVPERSFMDPRVNNYVLPRGRNITIINNTTNITNYTYIDNRVINRGIDVDRIERVSGRKVQRLRIAATPTRVSAEVRDHVSGGEVRLYRPSKSKLETVKVAERNNRGLRAEDSPRARDDKRAKDEKHPEADRSESAAKQEIKVAPRVRPVPRAEIERSQRQDQREQQQLKAHQQEQERKLEKIYKQEDKSPAARKPEAEVAKRQDAERKALKEDQQRAQQQLEARQKIKHEAVQATPPAEKKSDKATAVKGKKSEKQKADEEAKAKENAKEKGKKGEDKKPDPPSTTR